MNENKECIRKKVILFDSWTKGSIHIFRLLEEFNKHNIDIMLVHVGSWGDELGRPDYEVINGLKVHDINVYKNLENVIKIEKPDLVLFLSLDPLIHRAFNRYCQKYNIPTVNLYHGVHSVFQSLSADKKYIGRYWFVLARNIIDRLGHTLFVYVQSLVRTGANIQKWVDLFSDIYKKVFGIAIDKANRDAVTSYICVFNEFDQKQAAHKFSISPGRVKMVGTPDILKFPGLEKSIYNYTNEQSFSNESVVYIGTGVRGTKMILSDDKEYFKFLLNTYNVVKKYNKKLILKLHYSRIEVIRNYFDMIDSDVVFCGDNEFVHELQQSCGAIVEPSTAALVPLLMGKPIFLTQYGALSGLEFGVILSLYPKALSIEHLNDLCNIFKPIANTESETNAWIKSVAGPLPATDMPFRVVSIIESAIIKTII
jgi:hypothetical protein